MSDEPVPVEESLDLKPKVNGPLSDWLRALVVAVIALVVVLVLVWTGRMQTKRAEEAAFHRMGNALAQSLVPQYLERNWKKSEQELGRIAEAGNFSEITMTDLQGNVLASTSRSPFKADTLKDAPDTSRVILEAGQVRIERKVWLAQGNALGAVRFTIRR